MNGLELQPRLRRLKLGGMLQTLEFSLVFAEPKAQTICHLSHLQTAITIGL